jgi:hypothetical protein
VGPVPPRALALPLVGRAGIRATAKVVSAPLAKVASREPARAISPPTSRCRTHPRRFGLPLRCPPQVLHPPSSARPITPGSSSQRGRLAQPRPRLQGALAAPRAVTDATRTRSCSPRQGRARASPRAPRTYAVSLLDSAARGPRRPRELSTPVDKFSGDAASRHPARLGHVPGFDDERTSVPDPGLASLAWMPGEATCRSF